MSSASRCCLVMMRYGIKMTMDSAMLGSITIKNLVFPEWWLLWPLPRVLSRFSPLSSCSASIGWFAPSPAGAAKPRRSGERHGLGRSEHYPVRRPCRC